MSSVGLEVSSVGLARSVGVSSGGRQGWSGGRQYRSERSDSCPGLAVAGKVGAVAV